MESNDYYIEDSFNEKEQYADLDVLKIYHDEIRKIPLLKRDEETKLLLKKDTDPEAFNKLYLSNLRLVLWAAKKYWFPGIDVADLIQAGNIGLMRALDKFDLSKGGSLSTYAMHHIRSHINKTIKDTKSNIRIPINSIQLESKLNDIKNDIYSRTGKILSNYELAIEYMKTPKEAEAVISSYKLSNNQYFKILDYLNEVDKYNGIYNSRKGQLLKQCLFDLFDKYPHIKNHIFLNKVDENNSDDMYFEFYDYLKSEGLVYSRNDYVAALETLKNREFYFNEIVDSLDTDAVLYYKKIFKCKTLDKAEIATALIRNINDKVIRIKNFAFSFGVAKDVSLSSSLNDIIQEEEFRINDIVSDAPSLEREFFDNDSYENVFLDDYVIDDSVDFISQVEKDEFINNVHKYLEKGTISRSLHFDMLSKFDKSDENAILEFGKLCYRLNACKDDDEKENIVAKLQVINKRINEINTKCEIMTKMDIVKKRYIDELIINLENYHVPNEKIEGFVNYINKHSFIMEPNYLQYSNKPNASIDLNEFATKYANDLVANVQINGLLSADKLRYFVQYYTECKGREIFNLHSNNLPLEDNLAFYINSKGSPFNSLRTKDIGERLIFDHENNTLLGLAKEYSITRERVRQCGSAALGIINKAIMYKPELGDYIKNMGGKK